MGLVVGSLAKAIEPFIAYLSVISPFSRFLLYMYVIVFPMDMIMVNPWNVPMHDYFELTS